MGFHSPKGAIEGRIATVVTAFKGTSNPHSVVGLLALHLLTVLVVFNINTLQCCNCEMVCVV